MTTPRSGALPLSGKRIVVTRSQTQASGLSDRLRALGAEPVEVNTIALAPPLDDGAALAAAVADLSVYAQIAVASPNGARSFLAAAGADVADQLPPVACVGPSTAAVFDDSAFAVNIVPDRSVAEGLVEAVGAPGEPGARLLLVQAEVARTVLTDGLTANGWQVDRIVGYRTVDGKISPDDIAAARAADAITFTSSSTVERFVRLAGSDAVPPAIVSIGPITSDTCRELGLHVDAEAAPHTLDGLIDALTTWATV